MDAFGSLSRDLFRVGLHLSRHSIRSRVNASVYHDWHALCGGGSGDVRLVVDARTETATREMWRNAAIVGPLSLGLGTGMVAWAEQWISSGVAALLVTSVPLYMVLLEWLWKKGPRPNGYVVTGLIFGFFGIVLLVDPAELIASMSSGGLAALAILVASLSWSFGSILGRDIKLPDNPFMSTAALMIMGGASLILWSFVSGEASRIDVLAVSTQAWSAWWYLVIAGSIVAFSSYVYLLKHASAGSVATYAYVNPMVALLLGWWLADEIVGPRILLAVVVLVTAIVLISRFGNRPQASRSRSRIRDWPSRQDIKRLQSALLHSESFNMREDRPARMVAHKRGSPAPKTRR